MEAKYEYGVGVFLLLFISTEISWLREALCLCMCVKDMQIWIRENGT